MKYDVDYFIEKFEGIASEFWCSHYATIGQQHCAMGHCEGGIFNRECELLSEVFRVLDLTCISESHTNGYKVGKPLRNYDIIAAVNNGNTAEYQQHTPRARILAALYDIKKMQQPTPPLYPDLRKSLAVLEDRIEVDIVREKVL